MSTTALWPPTTAHMETEANKARAAPAAIPYDSERLDLARILDCLERDILTPAGPSRLRRSSYERNRVSANLEHARSLLLRLEHTSRASKSDSEIPTYRRRVKALQTRLFEMSEPNGLSSGNASSDDSDDESHEDLLARYAPARNDTSDSIDTTQRQGLSSSQAKFATAAATTLTSTLRSRGQAQQYKDTRGTTSGADVGRGASIQQKENPLFDKAPSKRGGPDRNTAQLLEHHESEQNALTDSMVQLARALKESTLSFADSLDSSNPLVDRTAKALDKSAAGMEAAEQKMGTLRRMTEGAGWFGRLSLYAQVAVLWVAIILVTFVLPKLRF